MCTHWHTAAHAATVCLHILTITTPGFGFDSPQLAKNLVGDDDFNVKAFMTDYSLNCPSALNRIKAGVNQVTLDGGASH